MAAARPKSSSETYLNCDFVIFFLVIVAAFFGGSRFGFVSSDKGDQLEVADFSKVAPIG